MSRPSWGTIRLSLPVELNEEIPGLLLSRRYFQANLKNIQAQAESWATCWISGDRACPLELD
jgi:hypothetical protein